MLRYFVQRREPSDINRDKTDLISTFLYRHPRVQGQWQQQGLWTGWPLPLSPFEIALIEILADTDVPSLPEEHVQLLRNFDPLREEIARYRDFNSLMDSGIVSRVRESEALAGFFVSTILACWLRWQLTMPHSARVSTICLPRRWERLSNLRRRWTKWAAAF